MCPDLEACPLFWLWLWAAFKSKFVQMQNIANHISSIYRFWFRELSQCFNNYQEDIQISCQVFIEELDFDLFGIKSLPIFSQEYHFLFPFIWIPWVSSRATFRQLLKFIFYPKDTGLKILWSVFVVVFWYFGPKKLNIQTVWMRLEPPESGPQQNRTKMMCEGHIISKAQRGSLSLLGCELCLYFPWSQSFPWGIGGQIFQLQNLICWRAKVNDKKYTDDITFGCFHAFFVGNGSQQVPNLNEDRVTGRHVVMEQWVSDEILNHA